MAHLSITSMLYRQKRHRASEGKRKKRQRKAEQSGSDNSAPCTYTFEEDVEDIARLEDFNPYKGQSRSVCTHRLMFQVFLTQLLWRSRWSPARWQQPHTLSGWKHR